jgi:hypothetical protein
MNVAAKKLRSAVPLSPNWYTFFFIFREIFVHGVYSVPKSTTPKRIVDCGANIGMAVLYYKWLWPEVNIDAYEPDPDTFKVLKTNVAPNNFAQGRSRSIPLSA